MIRYDPTRASLVSPGLATDFFVPDPACTPELFLGHEAALCAEMSRLAYADQRLLAGYLARVGFEPAAAYDDDASGTQGFLAIRRDRATVLLAFRGTEPTDPADLSADANFLKVAWHDDAGEAMGMVHAGFAAALERVYDRIAADLAAHPHARLLVTGHSLGAALACLMASRRPDAQLHSFGAPRVGDAQFAKCVESVRHERYAQCCDLVTGVPPELLGFRHTGTLHYIDRNGRVRVEPEAGFIGRDRARGALCHLRRHSFDLAKVAARQLTDHTPINYVSALLGLRDPQDRCA